MMEKQCDEFYYITLMNENYPHASMPKAIESDIVKGMYRLGGYGSLDSSCRVRLLGSGCILREIIAAGEILFQQFGIACDLFSVTSFSELSREARLVQRYNLRHPVETPKVSHLEHCLPGTAPIVAATDYVRAYPQLIASHLSARYVTLGTDGFGRSDTRAALRQFFEVDRQHIVLAALYALMRDGHVKPDVLQAAIKEFGVDVNKDAPWIL
jgi:pyruvate dehydrogenase E1 component